MTIPLSQLTTGSPYAAYAYSYPHKTAYRPLHPPRPLADVWRHEPKHALYLYLHIPFCEMRCGFCNLFTTANPNDDLVTQYLAALERQTRTVRSAIGPAHIARMAIGGGTPTYLSAPQLDRLFLLARTHFAADPHTVPTSVETSPRTADPDKLAVLRAHGVSRISIGVQSFVEPEVTASGRAQKNDWVDTAISRIRAEQFPTLNLDLIYGLPHQTPDSWLTSLRAALAHRPEELYLYPLYVRPLTGLERWGKQPEDALRLTCYRLARDLLTSEGYTQLSMRMFRRTDAPHDDVGTEYTCQSDGMIGLGCGARSYTQSLHYSTDYAVAAPGVREIITNYITKDEPAFATADYGCPLDTPDQKRRWLIKSLLRTDGLDTAAYHAHFHTTPTEDFPELHSLLNTHLAETTGPTLRLTPTGLERSDAIGPWLYSDTVKQTMSTFALR